MALRIVVIMNDYSQDDRIDCATCMKRCKSPMLVRCDEYHPDRRQADQRNGRQRWPEIEAYRQELKGKK